MEELNRLTDAKRYELRNQEKHGNDLANELHSLKSQMKSFMQELSQLKQLEAKYVEENKDFQKRVD